MVVFDALRDTQSVEFGGGDNATVTIVEKTGKEEVIVGYYPNVTIESNFLSERLDDLEDGIGNMDYNFKQEIITGLT